MTRTHHPTYSKRRAGPRSRSRALEPNHDAPHNTAPCHRQNRPIDRHWTLTRDRGGVRVWLKGVQEALEGRMSGNKTRKSRKVRTHLLACPRGRQQHIAHHARRPIPTRGHHGTQAFWPTTAPSTPAQTHSPAPGPLNKTTRMYHHPRHHPVSRMRTAGSTPMPTIRPSPAY
jgi:hypothetical protein